MTALRKVATQSTIPQSGMMGGDDVEMFMSCSASTAPTASDGFLGDATYLFMSGSSPEMKGGDDTGMFMYEYAPTTSFKESGNLTSLFMSCS